MVMFCLPCSTRAQVGAVEAGRRGQALLTPTTLLAQLLHTAAQCPELRPQCRPIALNAKQFPRRAHCFGRIGREQIGADQS